MSLVAAPGERLAVVGSNGAGKSTLLDAISGLARPAAGRVAWRGRRLDGRSPDVVARAGVARTFQTPRLWARMTVAENVRAGRPLDVGPWLELAGLSARRDELARVLTAADARRLALARALAGRPGLLLLDEPFGGLGLEEAHTLAAGLERAVEPGCITVLVEHRLSVVTRLCDRVVVLHLGEKIFDGPPAAMRTDARVLDAYLGTAPVS